jgi:hypothetical protein
MSKKKIIYAFTGTAIVLIIILSVIFAPPSVDVTSALSPVKGADYTLTGKTDVKDATVTVNGKKVSLHGGKFSANLDLHEGDNKVTIVVTDGDKQTTKQITIHRYTKAEIKDKFPVYTHKTVTEVKAVAFSAKTVESSNFSKGTRQITTQGHNGKNRVTYRVSYKNGKQIGKVLIKSQVILKPVTQITTVGTYVEPKPTRSTQNQAASSCDPHYYGCVPIANDVDCASGSGNGPAYVNGPVYVKTYDIYGLDRDGNGIGCE